MTGEDIKNFVFHDAIVREETLKEYFESFGMKFEDSIGFDDFFKMIKNNQKFGIDEKKEKIKKYEFKGDVIDEKAEEEENDMNEKIVELIMEKFSQLGTKDIKDVDVNKIWVKIE